MNHLTHFNHLVEALREYVDNDLPHYTDSLKKAFLETEPVFTRPRYSEFFWHCASNIPGWLPWILLANAQAESEGSAKLLSLWKDLDYNQEVETKILAHAKDESRHSRLFLQLTGRAFPRAVSASDIDQLAQTLPDVRKQNHQKSTTRVPENILIDHMVQMNIGEIRTRLHMMLLAPAIYAFSPTSEKETVKRILEGLLRDEVRHIGYTACLMEAWANAGARGLLNQLYSERLHDFHLITIQQTEASIHAYGQGKFPDLLEIQLEVMKYLLSSKTTASGGETLAVRPMGRETGETRAVV